MKTKTATLIGATGLIGGHLRNMLQNDIDFQRVRILVRRPLAIQHPKIEVIVLDFSDENAFRAAIKGSEMVFCSIGTTQKKVQGDKTAYRKVDFEIPTRAARLCAEEGCKQFLLVSSVGADSKSSNFYLQLKGEVEDEVRAAGVASVAIFRPSMLLGQRQEFRLGERLGQVVMSFLSFLIPSHYKAIEAVTVAKAMLSISKTKKQGFEIYHYKEMVNL